MKEKKINDIYSAIQLEKDDDFDLFAKSVGTSLYVDNEIMYCTYFVHGETRVVVFDPLKKEWRPLNKEEIDTLDFDHYQLLSFEEALNIYKDYPPFEALDFLKNITAIERLKRILKLRKTTPHKVIGWLDDVSHKKVANDADSSYFAAIINDIAIHHYFFYGDRIELIPVFEDGTYIDYSSRGWGDVIALSRNQASDYDYSLYAWAPDNYEGVNEPSYGYYESQMIEVNVSQNIYQDIEKYIANFYELSEEEMANYYGARYILLIDENDNYDQIGKIKINSNGASLYFDVNTPRYLYSINELDELIKDLSKDYDFDILVLGDFERISEQLKNKPALIVVLHE